MSLGKTLLTLTALRDGLKILWKPAAFWIAKEDETVDAVCVAFYCSLRKLICVASNELAIP